MVAVACLAPLLLVAACRPHQQQQPVVIDIDEAAAFDARGNYAAAERAATEAVALADRHLDPNHPEIPMLLLFLARQNMNRAHFEEAARNLERARRLNAAHFEPSDLRSIALGVAEAELPLYLGRPERSEARLRKLLATLREAYGPNHPFVAQVLARLAGSLDEQEELERAAGLYEEALGIFRNAWGERHPDVADTLLALALNRAGAEREEEAGRLAAEGLAVAAELSRGSEGEGRREAEAQHAMLLVTRGLMELGLERPLAARDDLEHALPLQQAGLGAGHPQTAWSRVLLGRALSTLGSFDEAEPHLAEGVETLRRAHGDYHPVYMNALRHRAAAYLAAGWYAEAVADDQEAEAIREHLLTIGETLS